MIFELGKENSGILRQNSNPVLIAYLNYTAYSRQLKALIELSEAFNDFLDIYVTRNISLKPSATGGAITGTPTFLLLYEEREQGRLLGEADTQRLMTFIKENLTVPSDAVMAAPGTPAARPADNQLTAEAHHA